MATIAALVGPTASCTQGSCHGPSAMCSSILYRMRGHMAIRHSGRCSHPAWPSQDRCSNQTLYPRPSGANYSRILLILLSTTAHPYLASCFTSCSKTFEKGFPQAGLSLHLRSSGCCFSFAHWKLGIQMQVDCLESAGHWHHNWRFVPKVVLQHHRKWSSIGWSREADHCWDHFELMMRKFAKSLEAGWD